MPNRSLRWMAFAVLMILAGLWAVASVLPEYGRRGYRHYGDYERAEERPAPAPPNLTFERVRVTGPHRHANLQVFLLHGTPEGASEAERDVLTLSEALDTNRVAVRETGQVNGLVVENLTEDKDIFIQAGDIVRGGKQDRVLATDMVLSPGTGEQTIHSYCVERGRWGRRGSEDATRFSVSNYRLSSSALKRAVWTREDQGRVWEEVARYESRVGRSLGVPDERLAGQGGSLERILDNPTVQAGVSDYVNALVTVTEPHGDAIGFAYAVNGRLRAAELFATSRLFERLWPKLLRAAGAEALAEHDAGTVDRAVDVEAVEAFIARHRVGQRTGRWVNRRTQQYLWRSPRSDYLETIDRDGVHRWIRRSFLSRE